MGVAANWGFRITDSKLEKFVADVVVRGIDDLGDRKVVTLELSYNYGGKEKKLFRKMTPRDKLVRIEGHPIAIGIDSIRKGNEGDVIADFYIKGPGKYKWEKRHYDE